MPAASAADGEWCAGLPEMHQLFHAVLLLLHRQHRIICKRRNGEKQSSSRPSSCISARMWA
ncbi:MAG: hypothetical protein ACLT3Y_08685 [Ruminococcus callidus]